MKSEKLQLKIKGWRKVKLGKVGKIITGKTPPTVEKDYFDGEFPFITPTNITNFNIRYNYVTDRFLSKKWLSKTKSLLIPRNSICFVCIGSTIGKMCLAKEESFTNQQINTLIVKKEKADPFFLFYLLKANQNHIVKEYGGGGAAKAIINKSTFENIKLGVPEDINEQRRIADILSAFDEKIEVNNKINQTLEEMAQAIFKEWFIDSEKLKMKNEKWKIGKLGEIMKLRKDRIKRYEEWKNLKLLDLGRFPQRNLAVVSYGRGEEIKTSVFAFKKWDILFGAVRPYFHKVLIAPFDGVTNSSVFVIYPKRDIFYSFLVTVLFSNSTIAYATQVASGTKMPVAKWEDLCKMLIIIPDEETIKNFDDKVRPLYKKIIQNAKENQKLAALRDLLLPKLMSGEMRV